MSSSFNSTLGLLRLMRPINSIMVGIAVNIGMLIASRGLFSPEFLHTLSLGFLSGFSLSASAMVINDYCDREIDRINEPSRPIPSGLVKIREALTLAVVLALLGLVFSAIICLECLIIAIIALALAISYNTVGKSKGLIGNSMVSSCIALPFIYGGVALKTLDVVLLVFASMAFLANMGREVVKGIMDVIGDLAKRVRTAAIVYGVQKAAYVASFFYLSAVVLSIFPWFMGAVSFYYIPLIIISDLGFISSSLRLSKNPSRIEAKKAKNRDLIWMSLSLLAFFVGTNLR